MRNDGGLKAAVAAWLPIWRRAVPGSADAVDALNLSRWSGQFVDPQMEAAFRNQYGADSRRLARAALVVCASAYLLFLLNDVARLGMGSELLVRVPLRLSVALVALWMLRRLSSTDDFVVHDRLVGIFGLVVLASYMAVNALSYVPSFLVSVSMIVLTMATFIGLPTSFRWNVTMGLAAMSAFAIQLWWKADPTSLGTSIFVVFTGLMSALLLRQLNALRRRAYRAWRSEREAREALIQSTESLRRMFAAVPIPFALASVATGRVLHTNDVMMRTFGMNASDVGKTLIYSLLADQEQRLALLELVQRGGVLDRHELRMRRSDGSDLDALLSISRVDRDGEECMLIGVSDVSDLKRLERELYQQAAIDSLTGIANRRTFIDQLDREFENVRRHRQVMSVLYLDLDHFKGVNDAHGHTGGDEVLKAVARTMVAQVRAVDLCGRLGGEEFAVLLPKTGALHAYEVAERIRRAVEAQQLLLGTATVRFTASIGCATSADGDTEARGLLVAADAALYAAKHGGRNRVAQAPTVSAQGLPEPGVAA